MNSIVGIDVSHNNGALNWSKLKATGQVQFAVIRTSHGLTNDRQFAANLAACKSLNISYAFYWYAESNTISGAKAEANLALSKIKGTSPLFVAYDAECDALAKLGRYQTTDVAWAACEAIQHAGYAAKLYINDSWLHNEVDAQYLKNKGVGLWYARPTGAEPQSGSYRSLCDLWQYSFTGKLAGNGSQYIDLNVLYDPKLIAKISGATSAATIWCDTTEPFNKKIGETYQMASRPTKATCGNGKIFQEISTSQSGSTHYTKFKAVGRGSAGFYVSGTRQCIGTVV